MKYLIALVIILTLLGFGGLTVYTVLKLEAPPVSDAAVEGKRIWQRKACSGCHTLFGNGSYMASDLTHVMSVRSPEWMREFFRQRPLMPPSTTKRHPGLNAKDTDLLIQFLTYVDQVNTHGWPPKPLQELVPRDYGIEVE